ncbi:MAG: hypothetical protein EBU90_28065, partial [Proteobacteria bacterium]|nr:hypothetical protein [Pseudomonadota bacterium]
MNLEELQKIWKEDSEINIDDLHNESLKVSSLHSKYYDIMLKYLEEIIKSISNRTYQIKNSI